MARGQTELQAFVKLRWYFKAGVFVTVCIRSVLILGRYLFITRHFPLWE